MAEQRRAFWDLQPLPPAKPAQPVAWIRQHPDGTLTGELLLDSQIEDVRKRSGAWVPLGRIDGVAMPVASELTAEQFDSIVKTQPSQPWGIGSRKVDALNLARAVWAAARGVAPSQAQSHPPGCTCEDYACRFAREDAARGVEGRKP